jgi:hypothetical protein
VTPLDKPIKRALTLGAKAYTLVIDPDGMKLAEKGRQRGVELRWKDALSGDAGLAAALQASMVPKKKKRGVSSSVAVQVADLSERCGQGLITLIGGTVLPRTLHRAVRQVAPEQLPNANSLGTSLRCSSSTAPSGYPTCLAYRVRCHRDESFSVDSFNPSQFTVTFRIADSPSQRTPCAMACLPA